MEIGSDDSIWFTILLACDFLTITNSITRTCKKWYGYIQSSSFWIQWILERNYDLSLEEKTIIQSFVLSGIFLGKHLVKTDTLANHIDECLGKYFLKEDFVWSPLVGLPYHNVSLYRVNLLLRRCNSVLMPDPNCDYIHEFSEYDPDVLKIGVIIDRDTIHPQISNKTVKVKNKYQSEFEVTAFSFGKWLLNIKDLEKWEITLFRARTITLFRLETMYWNSDCLVFQYLTHHFVCSKMTNKKDVYGKARTYYNIYVTGSEIIQDLQNALKIYISHLKKIAKFKVNTEWLERFDPQFIEDILSMPDDPLSEKIPYKRRKLNVL